MQNNIALMMDSSKEQIDDLKRRLSVLVNNNLLEEAKALCSEITNHRPEDAEAWCQLSTINGRLGLLEEAGECCQRSIALRPDYCDAYLNMGTILLRKGLYEEALAQYRKVLEIDPQHPDAYFNLGQAESALNRYDDAVANYRAALRLNPSPNYAGALKQLGLAQARNDRLNEARLLLSLVCEFYPNDADAWHILSTINGRLGNIDEAADCSRHVLAIQPDHSDAYVNLGNVHLQQGRISEAADLYLKALEINPQCIAALNNLARTCITRSHFEKYINFYLDAVAAMPDPAEVRAAFMKAVGNYIPAKYEPWLDNELQKCFSIKDVDCTPISLVTAYTLKYKYNIDATGFIGHENDNGMINQVAGDDLFLAFLEKTINNDAELEVVLTALRRALLLRYRRENHVGDKEVRAINALAHQCFNNEYVFATREDEESQVNDLKRSIEERVTESQAPARELEADLLVFGMYGGLDSLCCSADLAGMPRAGWSGDFRPFLKKSLLNPLEEKAITAGIDSIGTIQDRTSRLVQSQYEENPYPRWLAMPKSEDSSLIHFLKQEFLHFNPPHFLHGPIRILVAGCGTGQHPIHTALAFSKHHDLEITAVDISRRSLAYAIRMAREYNVKNIRFLQGDILELSRLGERFHIIECQGVLHHMERPIEGWRALSALLEESGLMSIGLYSKAGRASLAPMQEGFSREGLTPDNKNVREFRSRILKGELGNIRISSPDFYSTSGCRDLLFHFMEHQYTTRQLDDTMKELNLEFIGFTFEDVRIKNLYREHFPQDPDMTNLSLWGEFEDMYPDTFAKMYHFWCQKR